MAAAAGSTGGLVMVLSVIVWGIRGMRRCPGLALLGLDRPRAARSVWISWMIRSMRSCCSMLSSKKKWSFGRPPQAQAASEPAPQVRRRTLEGPRRLAPYLVVAERRVVHAGVLEVGDPRRG